MGHGGNGCVLKLLTSVRNGMSCLSSSLARVDSELGQPVTVGCQRVSFRLLFFRLSSNGLLLLRSRLSCLLNIHMMSSSGLLHGLGELIHRHLLTSISVLSSQSLDSSHIVLEAVSLFNYGIILGPSRSVRKGASLAASS